LSARFGANRTVATGMTLIALGFVLFLGLTPHTAYWYVVICVIPLTTGIALSMSPMTASIMSAVPARRAGAGSAMNDATRELGAALGIAVLGSIAASKYSSKIAPFLHGLSAEHRAQATSSIAGASQVASQIGGRAGAALTAGANHAFVSGIHLAVIVGAVLAGVSAAIVYRKLPPSLVAEAVSPTPLEAFEQTAEMGVAGFPPLVPDDIERTAAAERTA
jgi:hypothetical protein